MTQLQMESESLVMENSTLTMPHHNESVSVVGGGGSGACAVGGMNCSVDPYAEFYQNSQFVTGIILYPIIISFGLIGNTLTLIVLSHRKMLTSTNAFLSALAVADIIKLLNDTLYFLVAILLRRHPDAGNRMLGYMYPFSHYVFNESVCVSSWLTVSVAVERYISVCHATRARVVCTVQRARVISALVFLVMCLVAVPSALRYQRQVVIDPDTGKAMFEIAPSPLGQNEQFMSVYTWIQNLLRSIIPLFVLLVLNTLIIFSLRKERIKGKKMSSRNRITLMLIVVVIVFIICIFPDAIMSTVFGFGYVDESNLVKGIREFTDLLLSINSAVNFIIYCLCSKGFRDIFGEIFCTRFRSPDKLKYEKVKGSQRGGQLQSQRSHESGRDAKARHNIKGDVEESSVSQNLVVNETPPQDPKCPSPMNGHQQVSLYTGPQTYL